MNFIKKIKNFFSFCFHVFLVFVFLYSPRITHGIPFIVYVSCFSIIYILINFNFFKNKFFIIKIALIYVVFFIFAAYISLIATINNNYISGAGAPLNWIVNVFPTGLMLCLSLIKKNINMDHFMDLILSAGLFQALLAITAFFVPDVHKFFSEFQASFYDLRASEETFLYMSGWRNFGFASGLSFATPIVQSTLSVISIYLAIEKNYKYAFIFPILFFSALINARSSFIVFFVGLFLILFFLKSINRLFFAALFLVIFFVFSFYLMHWMFLNGLFPGFEWVLDGFVSILLFVFQQESNGIFNYFTRPDMWLIPSGLESVFGVGLRVMHENTYGFMSDIGYVNDIWLGGFVYSSSIYLTFFLFNLNFKKTNIFAFLLFFISFVFLNLKGPVLSFNNFTNLFFILYIRICLQRPDPRCRNDWL